MEKFDFYFYLSRVNFNRRSILVSKLTGLQALKPCHVLSNIEKEAAHVDNAAV